MTITCIILMTAVYLGLLSSAILGGFLLLTKPDPRTPASNAIRGFWIRQCATMLGICVVAIIGCLASTAGVT